MKYSTWVTVAVFTSFLILVSCSSQISPINVTAEGIAIKGYDPVAYFTVGQPVQGKKEITHQWQSGTWLFANKMNLELFKNDPARYAPQYGGYWAYAVSRGTTADIDPNAWEIVDGKLYLNLNMDIQRTWTQDKTSNIKKADKNWPQLVK